ncbi:RNA polymerase sigma factor [Pseudodesulfovibrio senegalensis]|jgi:RNA polymerase sigma-70 factor (ECF subfamily)|uniref:RNA polymerase sigma factor n=1 Tax=Pseudodesulfovibrio senegalensis TaxID=1721087 RepID=A0A6N6N790_9BACT|nr:RNA polymerase sigma factor [Pseudodesulfovibrio senegalensis]KAB1442957.1 RNA polymerase sigma factor [Pseudodesulfovibrio senegalensis]
MTGRHDRSDSQAIQRVLDGDVNAFEVLVNRYQNHAARIVGNHVPHARVSEVVQTVFINAFRSLKTYRGDKPFQNWLSRISVRCCYDFWREEYRNRETPVSSLAKESHDLLEHLGTGRAQEVFEAKSSHEEAVRILDWALEQLSPEDRMVVTLTSLEEKSVAEAAELLGWTKVNVKVRAHRARKKLKTIIEQAN